MHSSTVRRLPGRAAARQIDPGRARALRRRVSAGLPPLGVFLRKRPGPTVARPCCCRIRVRSSLTDPHRAVEERPTNKLETVPILAHRKWDGSPPECGSCSSAGPDSWIPREAAALCGLWLGPQVALGCGAPTRSRRRARVSDPPSLTSFSCSAHQRPSGARRPGVEPTRTLRIAQQTSAVRLGVAWDLSSFSPASFSPVIGGAVGVR